MWVNGYRYAASDQAIYIPLIEKSIRPELFPKDYLLDQLSRKNIVWVRTAALLGRWLDLQWIFVIGYLLSLFGLLFAVYALAVALFRSQGAAVLAVLFTVPFRPVFGTAISTFGTFFGPRAAAMPLAIGSMACFIAGRWSLAAMLCAACFVIHPLTALAPVSICSFYLLLNGRRLGWGTSGKALAILAVLTTPLLVEVLTESSGFGAGSFFTRPSAGWMAVIRSRNPYIFYDTWAGWRTWGGLGSYLALFVLGVVISMRASTERERNWRAVWIVMFSLLWFGIGFLFVEVYPSSLIIQMQVARSLFLLIYLSQIYAAYLLWLAFDRAKGSILYRALVVVLMLGVILWGSRQSLKPPDYWSIAGIALLMFLSVEGVQRLRLIEGTKVQSTLRLSLLPAIAVIALLMAPTRNAVFEGGWIQQHLHVPHRLPPDPWRDVQEWIAQNTPLDAVFFVPPRREGFRIFARRSSVGDRKDGAASLFSEQFAETWRSRMSALEDYASLDEEEWQRLAVTYQASFIVTDTSHSLDFRKLFDNGSFSVYSVSEVTK